MASPVDDLHIRGLIEEPTQKQHDPRRSNDLALRPRPPRTTPDFDDRTPGQAFTERLEQAFTEHLDRIEHHLKLNVQKETYTIAEAAERLGKAPWTVRDWCNKGQVPGAKKVHGKGRLGEWRIRTSRWCGCRTRGRCRLVPQGKPRSPSLSC